MGTVVFALLSQLSLGEMSDVSAEMVDVPGQKTSGLGSSTPPKNINSSQLKHDGTGRRSFPFGAW